MPPRPTDTRQKTSTKVKSVDVAGPDHDGAFMKSDPQGKLPRSSAAAQGPKTSKGSQVEKSSADARVQKASIEQIHVLGNSTQARFANRYQPTPYRDQDRLKGTHPLARDRQTHRVIAVNREELGQANFSLTDFMRAEVKKCPDNYDRGTLRSTRKVGEADLSLAGSGQQLEMFVFHEFFTDRAIEQLEKHTDNIIVDVKSPGVLLHVGQNHHACTKDGRPDVVRSEHDVTEHSGSILTRPITWILDIVGKSMKMQSGNTTSHALSEILENKDPAVYTVTSSEGLPVFPRPGQSGKLLKKQSIQETPTTAPTPKKVYRVAPDSIVWERKSNNLAKGKDTKSSRSVIEEHKTPGILAASSGGINLSSVLKSAEGKDRHYCGFRWPAEEGQVTGSLSKVLIQIHTQMCAANVDYAIITSYKETIFLVRDKTHKSVVHISPMYNNEYPLLLHYSAFLAMAVGLLPDRAPVDVPEKELQENLERIRAEIASEDNSNKWGILRSALAFTSMASIPEE